MAYIRERLWFMDMIHVVERGPRAGTVMYICDLPNGHLDNIIRCMEKGGKTTDLRYRAYVRERQSRRLAVLLGRVANKPETTE